MMYSDKIVAAIKVNGQVLREQGDTVSLPFGAEYSILVKNLNSVRAQISVSVDGKTATEGTRLIIAPNSSLELERFIRNGNLQTGNRFKFIERTDSVEKHRGIGAEDGLIRVEAWREHVQKFEDIPIPRYYDDPIPLPRPYYPPCPPWPRRPFMGPLRAASGRAGQPLMRGPSARGASRSASLGLRSFHGETERNVTTQASKSDAGITVAGSESKQQFYSTSGFPLEATSVIIVLRLRGDIGGAPIAAPVTVNAKPTCSTCGKAGKANSQFCSQCGTALALI